MDIGEVQVFIIMDDSCLKSPLNADLIQKALLARKAAEEAAGRAEMLRKR